MKTFRWKPRMSIPPFWPRISPITPRQIRNRRRRPRRNYPGYLKFLSPQLFILILVFFISMHLRTATKMGKQAFSSCSVSLLHVHLCKNYCAKTSFCRIWESNGRQEKFSCFKLYRLTLYDKREFEHKKQLVRQDQKLHMKDIWTYYKETYRNGLTYSRLQRKVTIRRLARYSFASLTKVKKFLLEWPNTPIR